MIFAGIDVGGKGCVALIDQDAKLLSHDMFTTRMERLFFLKNHRPDKVYLEKQWGVPVSAAATNFNLGCHFCCDQFSLEILKIPYEEVAAKTWQLRVLNFRGSKKNRASKKASIAFVSKKYPELKLPQRTLKDIDESSGIADSICIALYGRMVHLSINN